MQLQPWDEIIAGCRNRSVAAQSTAYRQSWRVVFPAVYGLLRNREEAEDVMQDGYVKAFARIDELREAERFVPWMKSICMRHALDKLRAKQRQNKWFPDFEAHTHSEHAPDETVEWQSEQLTRVKAAMDQLPEGYRVVIRLYLLEDMSHEDVAEMLGITPGTARSQYSRAMKKLKQTVTELT